MPMRAPSCAGRKVRQRGFSLIELMVTLTVAVIMLAIGVPSFNSFTASQKVKAASQDLMSSLALARSEAVKRNGDVTVAPDTADAWAGGWTVKWGTTTLLHHQAVSGVTITKAASTIVYKPTGRPTVSSNFEVAGSSTVRCVKVDSTGIPSTQTVACP
jgi:type IV fimbrial biogenesis protein FimT